MATNYTEHYGLSLWEAQDKFYHQEFNENHQKLDDALYGLAQTKTDKTTTAAMQSVLNKTAQIVLGTYVGNGKYGEATPNKLSFAGALDRPPKLVIIRPKEGKAAGFILLRGMTSSMHSLATSPTPEFINTVSWSDYTVSWFCGWEAYYQLNTSGAVYCYIAIG